MNLHRKILLMLLIGWVFGALPSWSQRPRESVVLTLENGESVEGVVLRTKKRIVYFKTWLGTREIREGSIIARRDAGKMRELYGKELKQSQSKTVKDHIRLARWCLGRGFTSGLAAELDGILRLEPNNAFAWGLIKRLAPVYRLAKKNTQPSNKPRWARREVDLLYAAAKNQSFLGAALIRANLDGLPDDIQLNEAVRFSDRGTEPQRWIAVYMLGESNKVRRVKPLYRRALGDPSWQVRAGAVASLKKHDDGTTMGPFERALFHGKYASTRVYAAEALGMLGDKRAVKSLVAALKATATTPGTARNHVRLTKQAAYVKDFDVEIAQAAVIADPIIDVVESGVVLDVAVVSVGITRRRISASLHQLTGTGLGYSSKEWSKWWKANKASYPGR